MKNPVYLDTTPPRFWSALVGADAKLHRQSADQTHLKLLPKTDHLEWGYSDATLEGVQSRHRLVAWEGRRWLGPLSLEGRLRIVHALPDKNSVRPDEAETGHELPWLGPTSARKATYIKPALADIHPQAADEIHAGYSFSPLDDNYMVFVRRPSYTSIYTLPRKLPDLQQAAQSAELVDYEPNPIPGDCQRILDEMRIGAGELYGFAPSRSL